ncbi:hypothetical protein MTO96_051047 [Rhipicephalus appendiculatus]
MYPPGVIPYRVPIILPMRRPPPPPNVMYIRGRSRSPSVISISMWYGVLASFVLIACILMVLIFESKWSARMQEQPKQFLPQRLVGPFGRPETAAPVGYETNEEGESIARARVKVEELPPTTTTTERTERYTGEYFAPRCDRGGRLHSRVQHTYLPLTATVVRRNGCVPGKSLQKE